MDSEELADQERSVRLSCPNKKGWGREEDRSRLRTIAHPRKGYAVHCLLAREGVTGVSIFQETTISFHGFTQEGNLHKDSNIVLLLKQFLTVESLIGNSRNYSLVT